MFGLNLLELIAFALLLLIPLAFGVGFIGFIWGFVANNWRTPEFWGGLIFFAMVTGFWL